MNILQQIQSELVAPKNQFNSFGKYKYRSCEDILEGLKKVLPVLKCSITLSDDIIMLGDRFYIKATATLRDENNAIIGETTAMARESLNKKGMDDSQITGTASSYARKYALNGLFAIDDTKDADTKDNRQQQPRQQNNPIKQQILNRLSTISEEEKQPYRDGIAAGTWKFNQEFLDHLINKYGAK